MIKFFQNLFGNAGSFIVDTYNKVAEFIDVVPLWVGVLFAAILTLIVVRVVINVT